MSWMATPFGLAMTADQTMPQTQASNPFINAYVSASAGTGKTKVLVDRLVRLLLNGTTPDSILCLTFTKAAAQEMTDRLLKRLESMSLMDDEALGDALKALGEPPSSEKMKLAKTLFFTLLDQKVKIQTLHGFCQSLIELYAWDLGYIPPLTIIDELEQKKLIAQALNTLDHIDLVGEMGYGHFLKILEDALPLSKDMLDKSCDSFETFFDFQSFKDQLLRLPIDIPTDIDEMSLFFLTKSGEIRKTIVKKEILVSNPGLKEQLDDLAALFLDLEDHKKITRLNALNQSFFGLTLKVKILYEDLKKSQSKLDFDDLIDLSLNLLKSHKSGEIERRLGYALKAILVDEAQDTSLKQWGLIDTLIESMMLSNETNTFFIVGDLKQSIYGFQGASPEQFFEKPAYLKDLCEAHHRPFLNITLQKSFRSTPSVLKAVDQTFNTNTEGLFIREPLEHIPHREDALGKVAIHALLPKDGGRDEEWVLPHLRTEKESFAQTLVAFIEGLLREDLILPSTNQKIRPEDIMILVRSRGTLVHELTKLCYHRGIPISGLDRFTLTDHLMVQDFLALLSWVCLKADSYHLACVLKSPFYSATGIDDSLLHDLCKNKNLWEAVQSHEALADFVSFIKEALSPFQSIHEMLMAVWHQKSGNFIKSFGTEAVDVFEELYSIAYSLETSRALSLQEFVWHLYEADIELKRDVSSKAYPEIRLMTVHGSKGLQSPVVILADTNIRQTLTKELRLTYKNRETLKPADKDCPSFLKTYKTSTLSSMNEEERRLLYVAMTRAEDHLYIFGKGHTEIEGSWYNLLSKNAFDEIVLSEPTEFFQNSKQIREIPGYFKKPVDSSLFVQSDFVVDQKAAKRGTLIHKLFELLPSLPSEQQRAAAFKLLDETVITQQDLENCLKLMNSSEYAHLFDQGGHAEFALIHDGNLLRLDRFIERDASCLILDFKTGKRNASKIESYKEQLSIYQKAITSLYPGKSVESYILWTDEWVIDLVG